MSCLTVALVTGVTAVSGFIGSIFGRIRGKRKAQRIADRSKNNESVLVNVVNEKKRRINELVAIHENDIIEINDLNKTILEFNQQVQELEERHKESSEQVEVQEKIIIDTKNQIILLTKERDKLHKKVTEQQGIIDTIKNEDEKECANDNHLPIRRVNSPN